MDFCRLNSAGEWIPAWDVEHSAGKAMRMETDLTQQKWKCSGTERETSKDK